MVESTKIASTASIIQSKCSPWPSLVYKVGLACKQNKETLTNVS